MTCNLHTVSTTPHWLCPIEKFHCTRHPLCHGKYVKNHWNPLIFLPLNLFSHEQFPLFFSEHPPKPGHRPADEKDAPYARPTRLSVRPAHPAPASRVRLVWQSPTTSLPSSTATKSSVPTTAASATVHVDELSTTAEILRRGKILWFFRANCNGPENALIWSWRFNVKVKVNLHSLPLLSNETFLEWIHLYNGLLRSRPSEGFQAIWNARTLDTLL